MRLIDSGKNVRPRAELAAADRDVGPDVCIRKGTRNIWIEAVSPEHGHENNPNRVADWPQQGQQINVEERRRQMELRVASAWLAN